MNKTAGEIKEFHTEIERRIGDLLPDYHPRVVPEKACEEWEDFQDSRQKIFFQLQDDRWESAKGDDERDRRVVGLGPRKDGISFWVAWGEEWRGDPNLEPRFVGAQWIVFAGSARSRTQVFRAEWDELSARGGEAAQPHWHFDLPLPLAAPVPMTAPLDTEEEAGEISLSRVHLGMAGWENPCHEDAKRRWQRWQRAAPQDLARLADWSEFTLSYICEQLFRRQKKISPSN